MLPCWILAELALPAGPVRAADRRGSLVASGGPGSGVPPSESGRGDPGDPDRGDAKRVDMERIGIERGDMGRGDMERGDPRTGDRVPTGQLSAPAPLTSYVEVLNGRGTVETVPGGLQLWATVRNSLPRMGEYGEARVAEVEIGFVVGAAEVRLEQLNLTTLFSQCAAGGESHATDSAVGLVRRTFAVQLSRDEQIELPAVVLPGHGDWVAQQFAAVVLGYRLRPEDVRAPLMAALLRHGPAADQNAAVRCLGLTPVNATSSRRPPAAALVMGLRQLLQPRGSRATHEDTLVMVASALALVRYDRSAFLSQWLTGTEPGRFDEGLQVLRAARLTSVPLAASVAFALPAHASTTKTMIEARQREWAEISVALPAVAEPALAAGAPVAAVESPKWWMLLGAAGVGAVLASVLTFLGLEFYRRRRAKAALDKSPRDSVKGS